MNFKEVKAVGGEAKSIQELENQFQEEHEKEVAETATEETSDTDTVNKTVETKEETQETQAEKQEIEIDEQHVLSFIKNKYNKELNSVDDLLVEKEEIPYDDVNAFLKFKKETGRGLEDFMKATRDYSSMDENSLLFEYLKVQNPELTDDDISFEMEQSYSVDEEFDTEAEIKKKEIARKKELVRAKEYFEKQKEQYSIPVESKGFEIPKEEKDSFDSYKKNLSEQEQLMKANAEKSEYFTKKTEEFFSKFDGYDFSIDEKTSIKFKPGEAEQIMNSQLSISNFISKFLDDNGFVKDAGMYHKSLTAASDPDAFAKFFYEKGKADQLKSTSESINNIDMSKPNSQQQNLNREGGVQVKDVDNKYDGKLRIKLK